MDYYAVHSTSDRCRKILFHVFYIAFKISCSLTVTLCILQFRKNKHIDKDTTLSPTKLTLHDVYIDCNCLTDILLLLWVLLISYCYLMFKCLFSANFHFHLILSVGDCIPLWSTNVNEMYMISSLVKIIVNYSLVEVLVLPRVVI